MTPTDLGRISSLQDAHTIFASRDTISVIFGLLVAIYQNVSPDATLKTCIISIFIVLYQALTLDAIL